jgi:hypothetical protein
MTDTLMNGRWTLNLPDHRATQWANGWEVARLNDMADRIKPGMTIIDVGAEEGDMSALFAQWAGPDGAMILVEPAVVKWPGIRYMWEHNDGLAPVYRWWVGFAARDTLYEPPHINEPWLRGLELLGWPSAAWLDISPEGRFHHLAQEADAIPRTRLDDLMPAYRRVDVITMDIEGAELEALYGATRILDEARPIVWVSIHPDFMRDMYHQHPDELFALMESHKYTWEDLGRDHEWHVRFDPR